MVLEARAVTGAVRAAEVDGVARAVGLVQQEPAAVVGWDRLQRVGVHRVAGAGAGLADDEDDVLALSDELAEPGELVCTKMIRIVLLRSIRSLRKVGRIRPEVSAPGSSIPRAHTIAPVVAVGEASARPADHGRLQAFQILDERFSNTVNVWDFRVLSNPDAVVDATPEVLREVSVSIG